MSIWVTAVFSVELWVYVIFLLVRMGIVISHIIISGPVWPLISRSVWFTKQGIPMSSAYLLPPLHILDGVYKIVITLFIASNFWLKSAFFSLVYMCVQVGMYMQVLVYARRWCLVSFSIALHLNFCNRVSHLTRLAGHWAPKVLLYSVYATFTWVLSIRSSCLCNTLSANPSLQPFKPVFSAISITIPACSQLLLP